MVPMHFACLNGPRRATLGLNGLDAARDRMTAAIAIAADLKTRALLAIDAGSGSAQWQAALKLSDLARNNERDASGQIRALAHTYRRKPFFSRWILRSRLPSE